MINRNYQTWTQLKKCFRRRLRRVRLCTRNGATAAPPTAFNGHHNRRHGNDRDGIVENRTAASRLLVVGSFNRTSCRGVVGRLFGAVSGDTWWRRRKQWVLCALISSPTAPSASAVRRRRRCTRTRALTYTYLAAWAHGNVVLLMSGVRGEHAAHASTSPVRPSPVS